jgi:hypothetical protein
MIFFISLINIKLFFLSNSGFVIYFKDWNNFVQNLKISIDFSKKIKFKNLKKIFINPYFIFIIIKYKFFLLNRVKSILQ